MPDINKKAVIELSKKGSRLFRSGQYEEAKEAYLKALEIDQNNTYVLSGLGIRSPGSCRYPLPFKLHLPLSPIKITTVFSANPFSSNS